MRFGVLAVLAVVTVAAGCAPDVGAPRAAALYDTHCVSCHGAAGQGDGPLAAELAVAPPDLTMLSASNAGVFPSDRVMAQIYGYPGRFHRGLMPEFSPVLAGPMVPWKTQNGAVVDTPRGLIELVAYLETLQQ